MGRRGGAPTSSGRADQGLGSGSGRVEGDVVAEVFESADEAAWGRRLAVVREHMESENRLDFDATIATFDHPRYELIGSGQVFDGEDEVRRYSPPPRLLSRPAKRDPLPSPCRRRGGRATCWAPTWVTSPAPV